MSDFGHDFVVIKLVAYFAVVPGHRDNVIHGHHGVRIILRKREEMRGNEET